MHVITAAHDFYPDPGSGGTGRYVYETTSRLVDRGHRVSVVTRRRGDVPHRETVDGIDVHRYDLEIADRPVPAVAAQLPGAVATVADHVSELTAGTSVDIVSGQGPVTSLLVGREVDEAVPRVPTFHSPWPTEYRLRTRQTRSRPRRSLNAIARRWMERSLLSRADHVVTLSAFMRETLWETYGREPPVTVVPGGVDADRFSPTAGRCDRVAASEPAFLTVRRLAERMGHSMLVDAFSTVASHHPTAHLYVAGDGPLREAIEGQVAARGLDDRVTLLGYVPDADLPAVYASADLFVLPTTALEGFGLATLEALASGLPVVGTPVGGTVEVLSALADDPRIPEPTLTDSVDADALAERMLAWAERSENERKSAGRACREHATERYPWGRTVSRLEALYRSVSATDRSVPSGSMFGSVPPD